MNRDVEIELREDIKEINGKLTKILESIAAIKTKQNIGGWVFSTLVTIAIAVASGLFGAHISK